MFADPPCNLGKDYRNRRSDSLDEGQYLAWCREWMRGAITALKSGGALFIYQYPRWAYQFATFLRGEGGLSFQSWIALTMKSTFPRGRRLYPAHYVLFYFTKTKGEPRTFHQLSRPRPLCLHCGKEIGGDGSEKPGSAALPLSDFWEDTSPARHKKYKSRPGINELKPMIPERCILMATDEGDLVLDPFAGGGSTLVAAERNGRRWIGGEVGPVRPIIERFGREFVDA